MCSYKTPNVQTGFATQAYIITESVVVQLSFEGCFGLEIVFDGFKDRLQHLKVCQPRNFAVKARHS